MTRLRALLVVVTLSAPFAARADIVAKEAKEAKAEAKEDIAEAPKKEEAPKAKPDKEGFVPVGANEKLSEGETLPGNGLLGAAYGFILAAMIVWIASVAVRARKVEEELAELRKKIDKAA